jgi:hypothetical protein
MEAFMNAEPKSIPRWMQNALWIRTIASIWPASGFDWSHSVHFSTAPQNQRRVGRVAIAATGAGIPNKISREDQDDYGNQSSSNSWNSQSSGKTANNARRFESFLQNLLPKAR